MTNASASVDENPVSEDPLLPPDDSTPDALLPGQMTFGWGEEPASSKKDSKKKARGGLSKKSQPVAGTTPPGKKQAAKKQAVKKQAVKKQAAKKTSAKKKATSKRRKPTPSATSSSKKNMATKMTKASKIEKKTAQKAVPPTSKKTSRKASMSSAQTQTSKPVAQASQKKSTTKKSTTKKSAAKKQVSPAKKGASPSTSSSKKAKKVTTAPRPDSSKQSSVTSAKSYADSVGFLPLKWGAKLPSLGFGFWKVEKGSTAQTCYDAIQVGYRHLDCACDYGNEAEVGQGIQRAIDDGLVQREELWITSKLWNTYHAADHVRMACEKSLADLQLDYLDLYLVHFPLAQRFVPFETRYPPGWFFNPDAAAPVVEEARVPIQETWQAMEELTKEGLVGNIGICNFGTSQIRDLLSYAQIRPSVLQVEAHPRLTQPKLLKYCQQEKIAYTAFSPLGAQSYYSLNMADPSESLIEHAVVAEIAKQSKRTAAQVLLRWGVQRGTAVIPKTSSKKRMVENIRIFDFELTDDQMRKLDGLNEDRRFNDPGHFGEAAFNTYLPIYE